MDNLITKEDEMFADYFKSDPQIIEITKRFCKRNRIDTQDDDVETLKLITKGIILKLTVMGKIKR